MRLLILISTILNLVNFGITPKNSTISASDNQVVFTFPESITFSVQLQAENKISEVKLIYGVEQDTCGEVRGEAFPPVEAKTSTTVEWTWDMRQSGSLPPGAVIWWQWEVTDEKGEYFTTDKMSATWLDDLHAWETISKEKIRLHSYQLAPESAKILLDSAVDSLARLSDETGILAEKVIDLYIYASSADMREAILYEPGWTGGIAYAENNIVIIGISEGDLEWGKRTQAHELTHVLVGDYTFSCLGAMPTWLVEGLAVYGEGGPESSSNAQFDAAVKDNTLLTFQVLSGGFSEDPNQADLSYSQSYYMVKYLEDNFGQQKMISFLNQLSAGEKLDDAMRLVYGFSMQEFEESWRKQVGVPPLEQQGAGDAISTPTMVPTMIPIDGAVSFGATPQADAQTTAVPAQVPTPATKGMSSNIKVIIAVLFGCTGLAGILIIAVIVFALARSKKSKPILPVILALVLAGSVVISSCSPISIAPPARPVSYPPLPTATAYVNSSVARNVFYDPASGFYFTIPSGLQVSPPEGGTGELAMLEFGDGNIYGSIYTLPMAGEDTLEMVAHIARDGASSDLTEIKYIIDEQVTLASLQPAWVIVTDGYLDKWQSNIRLRQMVYTGNGMGFVIFLYTTPEIYDTYIEQIESLTASVEIREPQINGNSRSEVLRLQGSEYQNPRENDPATTHGSGDGLVFSGLVTYNPQLELVPDLAQSWQVSDDGLTYTFYLHPEAVFHNGKPVTAQDVIYSWERAASQEMDSDTVLTYLGDIQGIEEVNSGKADHISGLVAVDEHTLQVTIDAPKPYFLLKLTYPTSYVVDRENVETGENWYFAPNGTGPYRLTRWESMKQITYERFDDFYGPKPKIPVVIYSLFSGEDVRLFESGLVDIAGVGGYNVDRFLDPEEPFHDQLLSTVDLCTSYISLDVNQPPFDDLKVRQAFAMALDRQKYVDVVTKGSAIAAKGLYPPGLPGFDIKFQGWAYQPDEARKLLAESKYGNGPIPEIIFTDSGYGSSVSPDVAAYIQMWEQNLGVKITVQNIEPEYFLDKIHSGEHGQLISEGWCADYPDPQNFADILFHSGTDMNMAGYANPDLDKILDAAAIEKDIDKRIQAYQKAEGIIVADVPAIFISHSISYNLVKPYVRDYTLAPMSIPIIRYIWIDPALINAN